MIDTEEMSIKQDPSPARGNNARSNGEWNTPSTRNLRPMNIILNTNTTKATSGLRDTSARRDVSNVRNPDILSKRESKPQTAIRPTGLNRKVFNRILRTKEMTGRKEE